MKTTNEVKVAEVAGGKNEAGRAMAVKTQVQAGSMLQRRFILRTSVQAGSMIARRWILRSNVQAGALKRRYLGE